MVSPDVRATGTASPDATVTVNGVLAEIDSSGKFQATVVLGAGTNTIEIIASDLAGDVRSQVLTVVTLRPQQEAEAGLFGEVIAIDTSSLGVTRITLDTTSEGVQAVEAAENTAVMIPGRETASAEDISVGDFLAVLATAAGAPKDALSILVKPKGPVSYAHFTGSIVGAVGDQISLMDGDGNLLTVDMFIEGDGIKPGEVVTALVHQDLKAGNLSVVAAELADTKMGRLAEALNNSLRSGARDNLQNLTDRGKAGITGHLTTLERILNRVDPNIRFVFADALQDSLQGYSTSQSLVDLGTPALKLKGVIEIIDREGGLLFVTPREGPQIELQLNESTFIRDVFGAAALPITLQVGHSIEALYDPQSGEAQTVDVIFPSLARNVAGALLPQAEMGELEGTIAEGTNPSVVPPVAVVRLASGRKVTLAVTPETRVVVEGQPSDLGRLAEAIGKTVKVRYDISAMAAIAIDTFDPGQSFFSGVVKSFIPKFGVSIPRNSEAGNIVVTTPEGETITLDITKNSIIQREGQRLDRSTIQLGDLVKPTSRYNAATGEVEKLVLKAPQLLGSIRGTYVTPGGKDYLTLSTDQLNLVTVRVSSAAPVTRQGEEASIAGLIAGERLVSGGYNPLALQALELAVAAPKSLKASGTVAAIDQQLFILTVTPAQGQALELLVPNKPGIITRDGDSRAAFSELKVGDKVVAAFFTTSELSLHRCPAVKARGVATSNNPCRSGHGS